MHVFQVIAGNAQDSRDSPGGHHRRGYAVGVAVVYFPTGQLLARGCQFVAGGQDGYQGTADYLRPLQSQGRQDAHFRWADYRTRLQHQFPGLNVLTGGTHVATQAKVRLDVNVSQGTTRRATTDFVGLLKWDHRVRAFRHRGARHYPDGGAGLYPLVGHLARGHQADNPQVAGSLLGSSGNVLPPDGVPVHAGIGQGRQGQGRPDLHRQGLAQAVQDGLFLNFQGSETGHNLFVGLFHR